MKVMEEGKWLLAASMTCNLFFAAQASAAKPTETDFFWEPPIVLSASRLMQPLSEAPAAITVIDRKMIEASGFTEVADLLRLVPGFQVALSTSRSTTAATYHGQSDSLPRRMEVLVDGRSVYGSVLSVDWNDLGVALDDIDRIEVVRGPSSPIFGANAFIATVNIITRPRYSDPGWYARATVGSRGTRSGMLRNAGNLAGFDYRLSLGYDQNDGFEGRNDEKLVRSINLRGWHDLNNTDVLDFKIGFRNGPIGRGDIDILYRSNVGSNAVESNHQQLSWTRALEMGRDTSVQFYHQYRREEDSVTSGLLSDILGVTPGTIPALYPGHTNEVIHTGVYDYAEERYDLEWQINDSSSDRLQWMAGAGLRLDRMESQIILGQKDYVEDRSSRVFANAAYHLDDRWLLNAGGMLEHGDTLDHELSWRLSLNYLLSPNHTLRGGFTRSIRKNGLLGEHAAIGIYFDNGDPIDVFGYSPPGIEPEVMHAWELGWLSHWLDHKLTLDVKAFREEIVREITSVPGLAPEPYPTGALITTNGGGVNITGLEGQLQYRPDSATLASLQFSLANAEDRFDPASTGQASREGRTPHKTISLLLAHTFDNDIQLSMGYYHVDKMRWEGPVEVALGKLPIPAYNRVDVRAAKKLRWPGQDILLELIAQNIGNGAYAEFRTDNQFETRYFLRASAQFR